tara:strand:+ start:4449 stop:5267 length:819 start_codon:yes stop_codon:yes gene_type:complete
MKYKIGLNIIIFLVVVLFFIFFFSIIRYESFDNDTDTEIKLAYVSGYVGPIDNNLYATPRIPNKIENIDCYFITNVETVAHEAETNGWAVIIIAHPSDHSYHGCTRACKKLKIFPQSYVPSDKRDEYDFILWFDNKFDPIHSDIKIVLNKWDKSKAMAMHYHPKLANENGLGSVYEEINLSMDQDRYKLEYDQYKNYVDGEISLKYSPENEKHYTCCFIIYYLKNTITYKIQETWWTHVQQCGIQDQISMFFVAQRFKNEIINFEGGGQCGG